jgi:phosphate starvation-inducible PhoH-like protein
VRRTLDIGGPDEVLRLFGPRDSYLKKLRDVFGVDVFARGETLRIEGPPDEVSDCEAVVDQMRDVIERGESLSPERLDRIIRREKAAGLEETESAEGRGPEPWPGVLAQTPGQRTYLEAMRDNDIVFCIGPAGTGKTFLAVAMALNHLRRGDLQRIVLCRPAVEAGESLGFLPGDVFAKVDPYLRPLYDALHDLMDVRRVKRYIENDIIEILPLAFVRGRTLDNAFIILDEAQNCTVGQMKTFLTRLGRNARLVVTGDVTQTDLPGSEKSGLVDAQERLRAVPGIEFVWLSERDIVRHELVRLILDAYQRDAPPPPEFPGEGDKSDEGG